jgi:hypothetical protein
MLSGSDLRAEQNELRFIRHRPSNQFIPSILLIRQLFLWKYITEPAFRILFSSLDYEIYDVLVWRHFGDETFWDNNMDVVVFLTVKYLFKASNESKTYFGLCVCHA